ncbi:HEAT repeat domain-containing protein, partial [Haliangium sp.]|uniref:HEAT repeat domain-containing protein n=1 Tax=Haliangium sp. TaxID=2663208 RepID=UPI003D0B7F18
AILDTNEPLGGRDFRDTSADLDDALWSIASADPAAVIAVLGERPKRTAKLARALGAAGAAAVETLTELLGHRDSDVRAAAARSLGRIGTASALAPIPALLADRAQGVRWAALEAIAEHLPADAEAPLTAYLGRNDLLPGELRRAAEALAALEWRRLGPAPPRRRATRGKAADKVRQLVAGELQPTAFVGDGAAAVRALLDGLRRPLPLGRHRAEVAEAIHFALQVIAGRRPAALLTALEQRPEAAAMLARALEFTITEEVEAALLALADHDDPLARLRALAALARHDSPRALAAIRRCCDDPSLAVRLVATQAADTRLK